MKAILRPSPIYSLWYVSDSCTRQAVNMSSISVTDTALSSLIAFGDFNQLQRPISHVHHPHCHSLNIKQKKGIKKAGKISYYLAAFGTLCQRDRVTSRFSLWLFILNAGLNEISDKSSPLAHSGEWRLIASRSFSELINETERQTDELMALPVSLLTSEDSVRLPLRTGLRGGG